MNQQRPPVRPISMAPNRAQQQMLMNPQLIQQYLMQTPRQFANQTPVVQTIPVRPQQRPPAENAAYIKSLQVKLSKLPQSQPDPSIQQKIKDMAKHKTVNCSYNKLPPQDEAKVIELLAILNVFYQHIDTLIYELYLLDQQKAEKMMQMVF
jgi:hypothetical protein